MMGWGVAFGGVGIEWWGESGVALGFFWGLAGWDGVGCGFWGLDGGLEGRSGAEWGGADD
jgi:hypothetical protein